MTTDYCDGLRCSVSKLRLIHQVGTHDFVMSYRPSGRTMEPNAPSISTAKPSPVHEIIAIGVGKSGVLEHKNGNISETRKDRGKLLWRAYRRKSSTLFRTVPSPTPYGLLFPKIGVCREEEGDRWPQV